jgi:hypothetical protein
MAPTKGQPAELTADTVRSDAFTPSGRRAIILCVAMPRIGIASNHQSDCVEHVFGSMEMSMGGKLTKDNGLAKNEVWWCLKNLIYNFVRHFQRNFSLASAT